MSAIRFVRSTLPLISFVVFACAFTHSPRALANSADRIVRAPNPAERVTLDERRAAWISPANDAGAVPDDLPLASLGVVLKRAPERERAFEQLLRDQQDSASPDYHRWLTPSEIGERFGATPNDIDAITSWLGAQGLRVDSVSNSRTRIRFSGSAGQIAGAFATSMRYYDAGGEKRIAAASSAAIPAAFADAIASIQGLDAISFKRTLHMSAPRRSAVTSPAATYCPGGGAPCQHSIFSVGLQCDLQPGSALPAESARRGRDHLDRRPRTHLPGRYRPFQRSRGHRRAAADDDHPARRQRSRHAAFDGVPTQRSTVAAIRPTRSAIRAKRRSTCSVRAASRPAPDRAHRQREHELDRRHQHRDGLRDRSRARAGARSSASASPRASTTTARQSPNRSTISSRRPRPKASR